MSSSDTSACRFLLPLMFLWRVYVSSSIMLCSKCHCSYKLQIQCTNAFTTIFSGASGLVRCLSKALQQILYTTDDLANSQYTEIKNINLKRIIVNIYLKYKKQCSKYSMGMELINAIHYQNTKCNSTFKILANT